MDDALSDRPAALAPIGFIHKVDDRAGLGRALDAIAVAVALLADLLEIPARVHEEIHVLDLPHRRGPAVKTPLRVLDRHIGRGKRRARVGLVLDDLEVDAAIGMLEADIRSEEHTSELQSLMRISYAGFCLKKKTKTQTQSDRIQL